MNGKTHTIGGIAAGFATASILYGTGYIVGITNENMQFAPYIYPSTFGLLCIAGGTIGGLFPDIDKKGTTISNRHPIISRIIQFFVSHRGALHTPIVNFFIMEVMMFLTTFLIMIDNVKWQEILTKITTTIIWINTRIHLHDANIQLNECIEPFFISFFAGVCSHIFLDMLTPEGSPIFWPICKKKISIAKLNGKKHGPIVSTIIIITMIMLIIFRVI